MCIKKKPNVIHMNAKNSRSYIAVRVTKHSRKPATPFGTASERRQLLKEVFLAENYTVVVLESEGVNEVNSIMTIFFLFFTNKRPCCCRFLITSLSSAD